ncbi:hypothetical protein GGI07_000994 [Coemansia sp. Benny D115]|nr:hypothetical protein GGI07_000994 [Coemansia sp. Benny D115]
MLKISTRDHQNVAASSLLTPPESPQPASIKGAPSTVHTVARPIPWTQFKKHVDAENLDPLGRSAETQAAYEVQKKWVKQQYGSMANYLTQNALADFIALKKNDGFDASADLCAEDFLFRPNDFPYSIGDGVEHWVLWSLKHLSPGFTPPRAAVDAIGRRFGLHAEWRYFVNPVNKQSVPQLSHAHVFVKRG